MSSSDRISSRRSQGRLFRRMLAAVVLLVSGVAVSSAVPASAVDPAQRIDLRVLLLDDNSPWVDAIESQMAVEGVLYTAVPLTSPSRAVIDDAFLSSGDHAYFQAVIAPSYTLDGLSEAERTSLRAFEAEFGVREVDGYNWANPAVGLNYAEVFGDINGTTAMVTPAGKADGFGYLNGPVPYSIGSYSYVAEPLAPAALPAGASFTTLVGAPLPSGATGSLLGVYSNAGVEQMIVTSAFSFSLPQYKYVAHGIISWATRGVHFGYNRNNFTFHVDDAFANVALWDPTVNCTPGEDCTLGTERSARMTNDDVEHAVQWMSANGYQMTLAFNGFYADASGDDLTHSLQENAPAFRWLNHGLEHVYQGCIQDFSVTPWRCTTDAAGNVQWMSQQDIYNEIQQNINVGQSLGLPFDVTEYLSGEHSGLFFLPQQPADNPNFIAALAQAGIEFIGSDASRDNGARQVGTATTIPRHPTALYYNTSTQADAVDEYNWLYTTRDDGGSGYCEDNPAVATCIAPLDPATGFTSYIVPTDANFDLSFILSNDPRPFYAHTSNLTGDRLAYYLLDAILGTYRSVFTAETPLVNLTLTEASTQLARQAQWAATADVSGYTQNGQITIVNPSGVPVPFTAPLGTTINGTVLQPYGGEASAWLAPAAPTEVEMSITGSTSFVVGTAGTIDIVATGTPAPTVSLTGTLPAGVSFSSTAGTAAITGVPQVGSGGSYPVTVTASNGASVRTEQLVISVTQAPQFTSAASATAVAGRSFTFNITTTGHPAATITRAGTLPAGITFTAGSNGTARLSGRPTNAAAGRTYTLTFTARNSAGTASQTFLLTVGRAPSFTSGMFVVALANRPFSYTVSTVASPTAAITMSGTLPSGLTFVDNHNGTGRISGTPARGTRTVTFTATNIHGTATRSLTLLVF